MTARARRDAHSRLRGGYTHVPSFYHEHQQDPAERRGLSSDGGCVDTKVVQMDRDSNVCGTELAQRCGRDGGEEELLRIRRGWAVEVKHHTGPAATGLAGDPEHGDDGRSAGRKLPCGMCGATFNSEGVAFCMTNKMVSDTVSHVSGVTI